MSAASTHSQHPNVHVHVQAQEHRPRRRGTPAERPDIGIAASRAGRHGDGDGASGAWIIDFLSDWLETWLWIRSDDADDHWSDDSPGWHGGWLGHSLGSCLHWLGTHQTDHDE
jgi:hypothetical protein